MDNTTVDKKNTSVSITKMSLVILAIVVMAALFFYVVNGFADDIRATKALSTTSQSVPSADPAPVAPTAEKGARSAS